ncbi:MAG: sarcosine oxidase [Pelagibacteraceae bacterium]|nr:sarcosine oxidase [Pelagibacteraceae bacterium]|tara:strand:- start:15156 stop:15743 length:588 start_codon:yes stop_codon:yes gene_type:complete
MSKITPLSNSHELGLHGNCKDKDEANLLVIREVTNIKIYQLSKFKKSNFDINNFSLDGYKLPNESGLSTGNENLRILWQAPNVWMIISYNENIIQEIGKQCSDSDFAITDLSHSRAILEVKGKDALNVIKKGSPLNLNNFRKNNCANSVYHGITVSIDMINDDPITLNIMALRSFAGSFHHAITDASLEFGFNAI